MNIHNLNLVLKVLKVKFIILINILLIYDTLYFIFNFIFIFFFRIQDINCLCYVLHSVLRGLVLLSHIIY